RRRRRREPAPRGRADRHAAPRPVWEGREPAARLLSEVVFRLVPEARLLETRANGQPALAVYTPDEADVWRASGLLAVTRARRPRGRPHPVRGARASPLRPARRR